ncbi:MAG: membrane dipeptidase [Flavobacteriaceae bacterium]|nr:membrane dipeptidase [Flavobacteriaceae bacterium]
MKKITKIVLFTILLLSIIFYFITLIVPKIIDKQRNEIRVKGPYVASQEAENMYKSLNFIADLHCDALLWKRDLLKDNDFGQVDIPKMLKASVGIQAFTIVTKSPKGQNFDKNSANSDNITSLFLVQGRPSNSLTKRAVLQCEDLFNFAKKSDGKFRVITSSTDFKNYLADRKSKNNITAGFLGVEGAHALDGKIENVQLLYDNGVRMMATTHFFDNKLGGSAHGVSGAGLTDFGKDVILKMNVLNMIIDVAHGSPKLIDDILKISEKPIISSHTGVKGTCDNVRNLSDKHIKAIANSQGLISIAMFKQAVCGTDASATAKAIKYVSDLVGVQYVALGSDFDGSVITPFDITGLPLIVEELMKLDFTSNEIQKIMGGNVKEFLLKNLP